MLIGIALPGTVAGRKPLASQVCQKMLGEMCFDEFLDVTQLPVGHAIWWPVLLKIIHHASECLFVGQQCARFRCSQKMLTRLAWGTYELIANIGTIREHRAIRALGATEPTSEIRFPITPATITPKLLRSKQRILPLWCRLKQNVFWEVRNAHF